MKRRELCCATRGENPHGFYHSCNHGSFVLFHQFVVASGSPCLPIVTFPDPDSLTRTIVPQLCAILPINSLCLFPLFHGMAELKSAGCAGTASSQNPWWLPSRFFPRVTL